MNKMRNHWYIIYCIPSIKIHSPIAYHCNMTSMSCKKQYAVLKKYLKFKNVIEYQRSSGNTVIIRATMKNKKAIGAKTAEIHVRGKMKFKKAKTAKFI